MVNAQECAILKAALADIENLGAPRHIDRVSAALGMDMVQFAKLGPDGMVQAIFQTLQPDIHFSMRALGSRLGSRDLDFGLRPASSRLN